VLEDFKRVLARAQSDYGFYVECQSNPAAALSGYDLNPDERSTLTDPAKLTEVLNRGLNLVITISGKHDWINRVRTKDESIADVDRQSKVATEVETIKQASTNEVRTEAVLRLMELIG
jgi:hypothetical protein